MSEDMSTYPADVLNFAAVAVEEMPQRPPFKADVLFAIAKAILAERERCASLVDGYEITLLEYPSEQAAEYYQAGAIDALLAAADAIRNTPASPPPSGA